MPIENLTNFLPITVSPPVCDNNPTATAKLCFHRDPPLSLECSCFRNKGSKMKVLRAVCSTATPQRQSEPTWASPVSVLGMGGKQRVDASSLNHQERKSRVQS